TIHELNEMYEYRAELEGFCAELAARRWTDAVLLERLTGLAQTQYKTDDRKTYEHFIEADTEFHIGIAQLSHNRLLVRAVKEVAVRWSASCLLRSISAITERSPPASMAILWRPSAGMTLPPPVKRCMTTLWDQRKKFCAWLPVAELCLATTTD